MASHSRRRLCSVVITGAGAGLGRELALAYASQGCIVFGTAASPAEVQELRTGSGGRVSLAVSDVTKFTKGRIWAEGVADALDGAGLDLLIVNGHVIPAGPLEAITLDAARHALEENVLGAMSIINAFLPALRRSRGRIVQILDAVACAPAPFSGLAGVTSAALHALLSAYRADLGPFWVDVAAAFMGGIRGDGAPTRAAALTGAARSMSPDQRELYGRRLAARAKQVGEPAADLLDTRGAAGRLIEILERDPLPRRIVVGADAEAALEATRHLSDDQLDALRLDVVGTC